MTHSVKISAILTAHSGKAGELEAMLGVLAGHSRAEPGNLRWDIWREPSDPPRFLLDELYRDQAAADAHHRTPHFQAYVDGIEELADRLAITAHPVDVVA